METSLSKDEFRRYLEVTTDFDQAFIAKLVANGSNPRLLESGAVEVGYPQGDWSKGIWCSFGDNVQPLTTQE